MIGRRVRGWRRSWKTLQQELIVERSVTHLSRRISRPMRTYDVHSAQKEPLSVWPVLVALSLSAVVVVVFVTALLVPAWPPQVTCPGDACKEAREWIAYAVTALVLLGGLYQYWRTELWKRAEFVASQGSSSFGLSSVRKATTMIDLARRRINLYDKSSDDSATWPMVIRRLQSRALLPHTIAKHVPKIMLAPSIDDASSRSADGPATDSDLAEFTRAEAAIRDAYDAFFDGIETFSSYIRTGLVTARDVRPYLSYWIADISSKTDDRKDDLRTYCILSYIEFYGFKGVQDLCHAFGRDVSSNGLLSNCFLDRVSHDDIGTVLVRVLATRLTGLNCFFSHLLGAKST